MKDWRRFRHEYYKMIKAFLECDPDVKVRRLEDEPGGIGFDVEVNDAEKYVAMSRLLTLRDDSGGFELAINVVPANEKIAKEADALAGKGENDALSSRLNNALPRTWDIFGYISAQSRPVTG